MPVCLSVRMEQLGSLWVDFHEVWYLIEFRESEDKYFYWEHPDVLKFQLLK
jgi:hypothetical protein